MKSETKLWVALIAVAIIALGAYMYPSVAGKVGGVTNYDEVDATAMKIGGTSGSRLGPIIGTTCNLLGMDVSQAASTTAPYDCAVTGVVSGDTVFAMLSSTTQTTVAYGTVSGGWAIVSAKASTTAGFVTVRVANNGIAGAPSVTAVGSSTNIWVAHPVTSVPGN